MTDVEGWLGIDLDGTLAHYEPGSGITPGIGRPIQAMVNLVKRWVADGIEVRIVTARVSWDGNTSAEQTRLIQDWLEERGLPRLHVTNQKDSGMVALYDDRAVRVVRNTGSVCPGCARAARDNP